MYPLKPLPVKVIVVWCLAFGIDWCRRRFREHGRGFCRRFGARGSWRPDRPADNQQQQDATEFQYECRREAETLPYPANVEAEQLGDGRYLQRCVGSLVDTGVRC